MNETISISMPKATEMAKTLDNGAANFLTEDKVLASVPLSVEERQKVKERVAEKLAALEKVDIYDGDSDAVSLAFADVFSRVEANKAAAKELANSFTERNFRGRENSPGLDALKKVAEVLHANDPGKFDLTEPEGFMRYIPMPGFAKRGLANYMRSFKEVQGQIDDLMGHVAELGEDGIKSKTELKVFDGKLLRLSKELRVEMESLTLMSQGINEYLVDLQDRDPLKAEKVRGELLYRLAEARCDTQTMLLQTMNGSILVSSLIKTQDMIITGAARASSSGRLILAINQTTAASADEQAKAADVLGTVNDVIGDLTESNAKRVKDHVKKMKELASSPIGQADKLRKAFEMGFEALDELRDAQSEVTKRMEANIELMSKIQKDAEGRIRAQSVAVGVFQEVVNEAGIAAGKEISISPPSPVGGRAPA